MAVHFEWDPRKARTNKQKHGVTFEVAAKVFLDEYALTELERIEDAEERWRTIGSVAGFTILVVAHTVHEEGGDDIIRIISARRAEKRERIRYEKERYRPS